MLFRGIAAIAACAFVIVNACVAVAQESRFATPNEFYARGTPTLIIGTSSDETANRLTRAQAEAVRGLLFPKARVISDESIDASAGPAAWPPDPVIYGGPQTSRLLKTLAPALPFEMTRERLVLGDHVFVGDQYRLIAVIPAREADGRGPGYPEFLLYAGTGSPGVGEINAVHHGGQPILVADEFGPLLGGTWKTTPDISPQFTQAAARRIQWRSLTREISAKDGSFKLEICFPEMIAPVPEDSTVADACERCLSQAMEKLDIRRAPTVTVYVYPDLGSIRSLSYPLAGIFFGVLVREVGIGAVRDHLYGATLSSWEKACAGAGTSARRLEDAFHAGVASDGG